MLRFTPPQFWYNALHMWYVYILQHDETFEKYVGSTNDLKRRIAAHNSPKGNRWTTRLSGAWVVVYAEAYRTKADAILREQRLKKHASGKVELFKRLGHSWLDAKTGEG